MLYDVRSRLRTALPSMGMVATANTKVAIAPASVGIELHMPER